MSTLTAWKDFLEARILQEKGVLGEKKSDKQALEILEKICATNPQNPSFLKAKAWSLSLLNREPEAASSLIEAEYLNLAKKLSGENDIAQNWISELEKLKVKISTIENSKISDSIVSW